MSAEKDYPLAIPASGAVRQATTDPQEIAQCMMDNTIARLQRELAAAREVAGYAEHRRGCHSFTLGKCNCGLNAAWRAAGGQT